MESESRLPCFRRCGLTLPVPAVALTSQTITFNTLAGKTYGDAPFTVSATASSGIPVTFSSLTTAICTLGGTTVTLVAAGTCTIQASQSGNATYAAATAVSRSFTVAKAAQTIAFAALVGRSYGAAPFLVSASASSGLAVSFGSTTTAICTVSGSTVTMVAAGNCTIQASQSGNSNYAAATSISQSFAVAKAAQSITFGALIGKTFGDAAFTMTIMALAVTYSSLTTAICTVSSKTVTIVAAGTCTIQAAQPGNGNYNAALNVSQGFSIAKAAQTISFAALIGRTFGAAPFSLSATSSSKLSVVFTSATGTICTTSGSTVTIVAAGTCTIQATQAGNGNFNAAASVSQSLTIAKAAQTIAFAPLSGRTYGAAPFAERGRPRRDWQ